jgi:hypothetical protein
LLAILGELGARYGSSLDGWGIDSGSSFDPAQLLQLRYHGMHG